MNNISLGDFLESIKRIPDNYDFHFEGKGDGTVAAIIEEKIIRIEEKNKKNKNKIVNLVSKS
jgi:hypothetical protein